ncbi:MAG TPA: aldehyde dehydrogenase family protein [Bacteroides sp.]|nr:aldehyde dehydrogenase family protein [Bacteroides sp.]
MVEVKVQTERSGPCYRNNCYFRRMKTIIDSQRRFFLEGHTRSLLYRKQTLRKLHDLLLENEIPLADALEKDFRKSFYLTVENELSIPYGEINYAIRHLNSWSRPHRYRTNLINFPAASRSIPLPYGAVLVLSPWNYPYMLSLVPAISALAAGNTVILKPSEVPSNSSAALARLINENFPRELFYVREGGADVAKELLKERFDKIFFTGSTKAGRSVMKAATEHLTPVTLELGGKNPVIVMPDCRLKATARKLTWGKFHNNGMACVSLDHVYAHETIVDALLEEIKKCIRAIYGPDPRQSPVLPRMINEAHFDRVMSLIDPESVVTGGRGVREDLFIEPTVLHPADHGERLMQQEVFGPVMPVFTYQDSEDLIRMLKNRPAPVSLYIFTRNSRKAKEMMREIPSGGGMINDVVLNFVNMNTPFGGLGESGMGNYHGKAGFDTFSHFKTVISKPSWADNFIKYPPYRQFNLRIFRSILGRSFRNFWH